MSSTYWNSQKKLTGTFDTLIKLAECAHLQCLTCSSDAFAFVVRFNTVEEVKKLQDMSQMKFVMLYAKCAQYFNPHAL